MPGIFGGLGCKQEQYEALKKSFNSIWGECESFSLPHGFIGGHAFSKYSALHVTLEGLHFAVDGEHSLYKNARRFAQRGEPSLFQLQDNRVELGVNCKGNVAIVDRINQTLHLATEWTGAFPLYYTRVNGGLLFSSHLRPLSKIVNATPDPIGMIQFMKYGFILAGRTFFKEIHRLMPGQALVYQKNKDHIKICETSRAWRDYEDEIDFGELVNNTWMTVVQTMQRCFEFSHQHALMVSGGWDTRLLLSAFLKLNKANNLLCYTHGDLKSREISIAKQIVGDLGIDHHLESFHGDMWDLQALQQAFDRVESVVTPYWNRAGIRLAEAGVDCVCAGVLGEIIGGRHGKEILLKSEWKKIYYVISHLLRIRSNTTSQNSNDASSFYDFLSLDHIDKPWYVRSEYWKTIPNMKEDMYAAMEEFVHRLKARGVENVDKLIEAYTAEHLGAQNLTAQLLCCRANVNIAIPYGDQELFNLTSRIPLSFKYIHSLVQATLRHNGYNLLRYPNAATLFFNSKVPTHVLEVTRVLRKLSENMSWKICRITQGRYKPKSMAWGNLECLRNSKALQNIVDNLTIDMLDKDKIKNVIKSQLSQIETNKSMFSLYNLSVQIMRAYNTELMLT